MNIDQKLIRTGKAHNEFAKHFQPDLISTLSANAQKLPDQSEAMKRLKFSGAWPKVNQACGGS